MGLLRLFLALSVAIQHAGGSFGIAGPRAVEIFFIISGFYMGLILSNGKYQSYRTFITNRFLRIFPVYWAISLLTMIASILLILCGFSVSKTSFASYGAYGETLGLIPKLYCLISNIFIFTQDWVFFLGLKDGAFIFSHDYITSPAVRTFQLVPQAWSLSIELMFYLIAPFLLWRQSNSLALIIVLAVMSLLCSSTLLTMGYDNPCFLALLYLFLFGILAHRFYASHIWLKLSRKNLIYGFVGVGILMVFYSFFIEPHKILLDNVPTIKFIRLFITFTFSNITMALMICGLFHLTAKNSWDRWIGELSYPVYVCHIFVIAILTNLLTTNSTFPYLVATVSVLLSILLARWIQKPVDDYREFLLKRSLRYKNYNNLLLQKMQA